MYISVYLLRVAYYKSIVPEHWQSWHTGIDLYIVRPSYEKRNNFNKTAKQSNIILIKRHYNKIKLYLRSRLQFRSSEPSAQSSFPSHTIVNGIHVFKLFPFSTVLHVICFSQIQESMSCTMMFFMKFNHVN